MPTRYINMCYCFHNLYYSRNYVKLHVSSISWMTTKSAYEFMSLIARTKSLVQTFLIALIVVGDGISTTTIKQQVFIYIQHVFRFILNVHMFWSDRALISSTDFAIIKIEKLYERSLPDMLDQKVISIRQYIVTSERIVIKLLRSSTLYDNKKIYICIYTIC